MAAKQKSHFLQTVFKAEVKNLLRQRKQENNPLLSYESFYYLIAASYTENKKNTIVVLINL